jgi:hypothetical protein
MMYELDSSVARKNRHYQVQLYAPLRMFYAATNPEKLGTAASVPGSFAVQLTSCSSSVLQPGSVSLVSF